jgi:hypothetical protein
MNQRLIMSKKSVLYIHYLELAEVFWMINATLHIDKTDNVVIHQWEIPEKSFGCEHEITKWVRLALLES